MRTRVLLILAILHCHPAYAQVFKCVGKYGKVIYQSQPCVAALKSEQLDIATDPDLESKAQANLDAVRSEYDARAAAQKIEDKAAAEEREKAAQLEYARRSATAQQEQAEAQKRQAELLEQQNQNRYYNNYPLLLLPPRPPLLPGHPPVRPEPRDRLPDDINQPKPPRSPRSMN